MVPVIALLLLIIVVILFQVYRSLEAFTVYVPIALTLDTTFGELVTDIQKKIETIAIYKDAVKMIQEVRPTIQPNAQEQALLTKLNETSIPVAVGNMDNRSFLQSKLDMLTESQRQRAIPNTEKLRTALAKVGRMTGPEGQMTYLTQDQQQQFLQDLQTQSVKFNDILDLVKIILSVRFPNYTVGSGAAASTGASTTTGSTTTGSTAGSTTAGSTTTGSTAGSTTAGSTTTGSTEAAPTTDTTTGSSDWSQLYRALCAYTPGQAATSTTAAAATTAPATGTATPSQAATTPAAAPAVSESALSEIVSRLQQSISKQVKDEVLAQRATTVPTSQTSAASCEGTMSTATSQGAEYQQALPPAPAPDMSQYIRKDSIPCWGCTLPN